MNARPVAVIGQNIRIKRDDGAEFTVAPDIFSEKDQKFLKEWRLTFLMDQGRLLKINTKEGGTRKERSQDGGIESWDWNGYYEITLENSSDIDLKNVRVEYVFFKFDDQIAADSRKDGDYKKQEGEYNINFLSARKSITTSTERIAMQKTELDAGYYWVGGGAKKSMDKLLGISMKIYVGDQLIARYASPKDILDKVRTNSSR